jgi:periplasmic divalent cation tolerance protein
MPGFIQIQWTAPTIEEARQVARQLVEKKYVACANIIPFMESIYIWENRLESTQEVKVFLKTRLENFDLVKSFIEGNTSYSVPEITQIQVDQANPAYVHWVMANTEI